jgi:predicted peptidase
MVAVAALLVQLSWPSFEAWLFRPQPGKQVGVEADPYNYLIYLPPAFQSNSKQSWPLLLNLHGAGERGQDLENLFRTGLPTAISEGLSVNFIVVSPQCPARVGWDASKLQDLLDDLEKKYPISCVAATGYSMGGFGSWSLAQATPDRLAAIAPICGGGNPSHAKRLVDMPIWAFHGANDDVVTPDNSLEMVDAINASGGKAMLTLYPNKGHNVWDSVFRDERLFQWLTKCCIRQKD